MRRSLFRCWSTTTPGAAIWWVFRLVNRYAWNRVGFLVGFENDVTNNPWVEQKITSTSGPHKIHRGLRNVCNQTGRAQEIRERGNAEAHLKKRIGMFIKNGQAFFHMLLLVMPSLLWKGNCFRSPQEWNTSHWAGYFLCLCFLRQRLVSAMKEFRPDVLLSWLENASKVEPGWPELDTVYLCALCACLLRNRFIYCIYVYFCLLLLSLEFKISCGHLRILSAYLCICDCMNVGIPLQIPVLFLGMQVRVSKHSPWRERRHEEFFFGSFK